MPYEIKSPPTPLVGAPAADLEYRLLFTLQPAAVELSRGPRFHASYHRHPMNFGSRPTRNLSPILLEWTRPALVEIEFVPGYLTSAYKLKCMEPSSPFFFSPSSARATLAQEGMVCKSCEWGGMASLKIGAFCLRPQLRGPSLGELVNVARLKKCAWWFQESPGEID